MPKAIGALKKDAEGKLETTAVLSGGTAIIGAISNTTFNQGAVSDHARWMQGLDYISYLLRYVRVNSEGKLETVGIIESGTIGEVGRVGTVGNISDIGRIGTIGDIEHLGSIANTSFDQGSVSDHKREMYMRQLGTWIPVEGEDENLKTASVLQHGTASIGDINTVATVGHVDSLGTVEHVNRIDELGTVGRLETVGMIEAGTISEVSRVGTVGNIGHMGSIGNTKFNQGSLDDHDRWIKGDDGGTKRYVKVDADGKLKTVSLLEAGTASIGDIDRVATIGHLGSIANVSFDQGAVSDHERHMHIKQYGTWAFLQGTSNCAYVEPLVEHNNALVSLEVCNMGGLITAPGWDGVLHVPLQTDDYRRLEAAPATSRKGGKKLVTNMGTAVPLVASSTPCISLIVKALHTNAGEVYVGDNTVGSATGYILQKDEFVSFSADDVNGVYIDRDAGTQGVSFLYVNY